MCWHISKADIDINFVDSSPDEKVTWKFVKQEKVQTVQVSF